MSSPRVIGYSARNGIVNGRIIIVLKQIPSVKFSITKGKRHGSLEHLINERLNCDYCNFPDCCCNVVFRFLRRTLRWQLLAR
jgi:hypothetical protein